MNIIGLDELVFGVEDVAGCTQFLTDYGLTPVDVTDAGGRFEALDGTAVVIAHQDDPALPEKTLPNCQLRKTVMAVASHDDLDAVANELSKDRDVKRLQDGSIESIDDCGFVIGFQISVRRPIEVVGELANAPGAAYQRPVNHTAVNIEADIKPKTLSHVVYFVPDVAKAEAFYAERLGFRCTDRFADVGPFMQPAGTLDHHTHFFISAPPQIQGVEHFTFHFAGPTEVLQNGSRFVEKGYQAFWGPGRHVFGSNWFWYFNSPFGCHIEMDADMDLHDENWSPRSANISADASQAFLTQHRKKWFPGPGAPKNGDYA
ncbi:VOC family protein [Marinobacter sp. NFXS9]|uniref:VOC family protein n=1 Tax=Marinobacter sp. NFXS9 TaxID=2818433 RepID=UPI0032DED42C